VVSRTLTIAWTELVRLFRDRSNLFFVLLFPLLLVVLIGAGFGGSFDARVGVSAPSGDPRAEALLRALDDAEGVTVVEQADLGVLEDSVSRGRLSAGLVVPPGYTDTLERGEPVQLGYIGRADASALSIRAIVDAVVSDQSATLAAARAASSALDQEPGSTLALAEQLRGQLPRIGVDVEEVGGDELAREFAGLGQFDLGASSQLFLFTFLTALSAGAALIQTRELGVARRMLSTPTSAGTILAGQATGRIAVAIFQATYLVLATWLLFRVDWGDPLATGVVVLLFCVLSGAAGMLLGATFRTDSQAGGVGIGLGLGMAALGGSMVPLEIFPEGMRAVAFVTPHAWANTAMAEIVRRDGGLGDVLLEVGVLALYAVVLLALAAWRLQRVLSR
jgi:ABC-2 type transport system permease protein